MASLLISNISLYNYLFSHGQKSCSIFLIPDQLPPLSDFFNWTSVYIFFGWFAFQAVIAALPIGQVHLGLPLKNGQRLPYRCNGQLVFVLSTFSLISFYLSAFIAFVLSVCGFFVLIYQGYDPSVVYENFLPLASIATVFSYVMSCYLYLRSHTVPENELAEGGNSGECLLSSFDHSVRASTPQDTSSTTTSSVEN